MDKARLTEQWDTRGASGENVSEPHFLVQEVQLSKSAVEFLMVAVGMDEMSSHFDRIRRG